MKRRTPVYFLVGFCALFAPAVALCQPQSVILAASSARSDGKVAGVLALLPDNPDIPPRMLDLMRTSQGCYIEGSSLIKAGESAKARIAFDQAVDYILQSEWDLPSNPVLNGFFQDLVRSIQRDESRYLRPDEDADAKPERAVYDELEKVDLIPIRVDPALKDAVEADILNTRYDIPVMVNESVLKSMDFWLNKGRKYFVDGLMRSGRYQEMIERVFREESLPLDLMYLAQVESLFKTNALSRALAMGIWQFGKGTAIRYGLKVNRYIDERSDPEKSTRAAARYLNDLYAMFRDWNLVLAAYNWGEGKVQRLVDKSGVADFWFLAELKRKMPQETKNHVPMIMASIILARNPEKYGLPIELEGTLRYDQVPMPRRINLTSAAKALDIPVDALKKLNPALKGSYTPPDYPGFKLKVPEGMGQDFAEKLAALPSADLRADPTFSGRYKVQSGDTLSVIASRYRVSVEDIMAANDLRSAKALRAGEWIVVPVFTAAVRQTKQVSAPAPAPAPLGASHEVKNGESLSEIAQRYRITVAALQGANGLGSSSKLRVGMILKVPSAGSTAEQVSQEGNGRRHQIRSGDTLYSIAVRYGVTVASIQRANGIRSPQSLQVGAWLQIPSQEDGPSGTPAIARKSH